MNNQQIKNQLKDYKNFVGVFPCDLIPQLEPGQALIVNTDPHYRPGEHWVAFYKSHTFFLEYFDPFGLPPLVWHIREYINRSDHTLFSYSTVQLQHESSTTCGNHCIAFVKHRLLNLPFETLLAHFTTTLLENDRKVFKAILHGVRS